MNLKVRLSIMNFLQFAVWGAYLTCMGIYLGRAGMGSHIGTFFALQGFVSIFMPALMGIVADRWVPAQYLYGICHLFAGTFMIVASYYAFKSGSQVDFSVLFPLYALSVAFYMPSLALSYSVAYTLMRKAGMDTVNEFPAIRVFGTIGFIASMWFVDIMDFEQNQNQFLVSGLLSIVLFIYSFTLPACPVNRNVEKKSLADALGLRAFSMFKQKEMAVFFIFAALIGVCLQIANGFATPYIDHFQMIPEYADTFGVKYPVVLYSISQISETCCILLIPFCMRRYGIKIVIIMALLAWVLRFGFLGMGNPGSGVWLFIASMIIYGVAFDFFNICGSLYVDRSAEPQLRSSAQGLLMLMTNGLGCTFGSLIAQAVVNAHTTDGLVDWPTCWYIFAGYAFVLLIVFTMIFRPKTKHA